MGAEPSGTFRLYCSPTADLTAHTPGGSPREAFFPLFVDRCGLTQSMVEKYPFLKGATRLRILEANLPRVPALLKGQSFIAKMNGATPTDVTSLQIAGV